MFRLIPTAMPLAETVAAPRPSLPAGWPASGEIARFGEGDAFALKLAVSEADRLKAWRLVYREYRSMGYVRPQALEYRYSIHDALPDAITILIERDDEAVGTVSVYPDSPLGLPADEAFGDRLAPFRRAGRRPAEIGRLTIGSEYANDRAVLLNLLDALAIGARAVRQASDLVITVNPCHAHFYERAALFERLGEKEKLDSVCGAPAVLLRLDADLEVAARRHAHGEGPRPEGLRRAHTIYSHLSGLAEECRRAERMRRACRRPDERFIRRWFMQARPLIQNLPPAAREFMQQCYPGLRPAWPARDTAAL